MSDLFSLSGKVALVTGASSGLGARFAEVLAKYGASVVCCARRQDRLDDVVGKIAQSNGKALAYQLDVTDSGSIGPCFEWIEDEFGVVDVLVNAAGGNTPGLTLRDTSVDDWQTGLNLNLTPFFTISKEASARLIAEGKPGSIINVASIGGVRATAGSFGYTTPKAACIHLTKSMALHLAPHNIRCNVVCPGLFSTELVPAEALEGDYFKSVIDHIPLGGPADAADLDGIILLLASDASRFMTGAELIVDGGQTLGTPGYD